jgi:hypothetical protein
MLTVLAWIYAGCGVATYEWFKHTMRKTVDPKWTAGCLGWFLLCLVWPVMFWIVEKMKQEAAAKVAEPQPETPEEASS